MRAKRAITLVALAGAYGVGVGAPASTWAAVFTYTPPAAGTGGTDNWSTSTHWNAAPVSDVDTQLIFGGTLDAAAVVASANDVANPFELNNLTVNASGPATGAAPTYTISGSQLKFLNSSTAVAPTLTLNTGGTVKPAVTISSAIDLGSDITIDAATNGTLSGRITGENNIVKTGAGTLFLSNNTTAAGSSNTFGGAGKTITVQGGTLRTTSNANFASLGSASNKIVLQGGTYIAGGNNDAQTSFDRTLEFGSGSNSVQVQYGALSRELWIGGALMGSGNFSIASTAAPLIVGRLDGTSDFSGTVTVQSRNLYVGANATRDALANGNVNLNGTAVHFGGSSATPVTLANFSRTITVSANSGLSVANNHTFNHTGTLTGAGALSVNGVTAAQEAKGTVAAISRADVNSVVVLNGDMSAFTGNVSVAQGTLLVGSTLVSGGTMTVANGATLGGTGLINRNTAIGSGTGVATLAPGAGPGSLEIGGNLAINTANGITMIELGGTAFSLNTTEQYDRINLTGETPTLTLDGELDVSLIDSFALAPGQAFGIIQLGSGATRTGTFAGLATDDALVGTFGGENLFITYSANFGNSGLIGLEGGNDVALYTAVPEPTSLLTLGLGAAGGLARRGRRARFA